MCARIIKSDKITVTAKPPALWFRVRPKGYLCLDESNIGRQRDTAMNQTEMLNLALRLAAVNSDHPIHDFFAEIAKANTDRFKVIVAHGVLEALTDALIECHCKNGKNIVNGREYTHSIKLLILHEKGILTDSRYKWLSNFRQLRNKAAHGTKFTIEDNQLQKFKVTIAKRFDKHLKLNHVCTKMVTELWNEHSDILGKHFKTTNQTKAIESKKSSK